MFDKLIILTVLAGLFANTLDELYEEFQQTVRESFDDEEEETAKQE